MGRRKIVTALAAALALGASATPAGAGPVELFGNGWAEAYDGVIHCTTNDAPDPTNQVVCDKIGPGWSYVSRGVVEFFYPWWCEPVGLIGGSQGGAPARIRLGGVSSVGCALGVYPSSTQAWAMVEGNPPRRTQYAGSLALRPNGFYGDAPTAYLTVERGCNLPGYTPTNCPPSATYSDVVVY